MHHLLLGTLGIEGLACPKCAGRMRVLALVRCERRTTSSERSRPWASRPKSRRALRHAGLRSGRAERCGSAAAETPRSEDRPERRPRLEGPRSARGRQNSPICGCFTSSAQRFPPGTTARPLSSMAETAPDTAASDRHFDWGWAKKLDRALVEELLTLRLLTILENRRKRFVGRSAEKWRRLTASRSRSLRPQKMNAQG